MTGNLIGETFDQVVFDQIKARQKLYGSGFSNNSKISTNELQLLNNLDLFHQHIMLEHLYYLKF